MSNDVGRKPDSFGRLPAESSSEQSNTPQASAPPQSYVELFHEYRNYLFSIAYRMLGSRVDAEDMLQETFLKWQGVSQTEIRDPRAFLVTVITRLCINQLQSARSRREEYFGHWLPEPLLTQTIEEGSSLPDLNESLSMAFLILLERLNPLERAVFLLREVFEYEYTEVAEMLDQNEANCRQILSRARRHMTDDRPRFDTSPQQRKRLLQQFLEATSHGNMEGLLSLLASDVVLYADGGGKATAVPNPIYGADRVARFFVAGREKLVPSDLVSSFAEINGQLGLVAYHQGQVFGVLTVDIAEGRIRNIYIVRNPEKLALLPNLPQEPF